MQCPQHSVEFVLKPAGVSRKTGRPYNAFYVCPTYGCQEKPPQGGVPAGSVGGWQGVRQQVAQKVAPEKAVMTKEDWERKEERTDRKILLQVAFKAAVELYAWDKEPTPSVIENIQHTTLHFHSWLLSQLTHEKPASGQTVAPRVITDEEPPLDSFMNDPEADGIGTYGLTHKDEGGGL